MCFYCKGAVVPERGNVAASTSGVSSLSSDREKNEGTIQEHTKKSLLQHLLTPESSIDNKSIPVDHAHTEPKQPSMAEGNPGLSDNAPSSVEKDQSAETLGHPLLSPRPGQSPTSKIKTERLPSLVNSGGQTENYDNGQHDGSANKQEVMSVDEEMSSFRGTPFSAVSVNPMLMDDDSQHNFSQDGLSSIGDPTVVSVRWPKVKVDSL